MIESEWNKRNNSKSYFAIILLITILSSCTLLDPGVHPDKQFLDTYNATPTLPNAIAVANSLQDEFGRKVDNQILLTRAVGLTLIPMAAGAAGLGIRSDGPDGILALGLTGASMYTATTFLTSKQQQYIYAAGANAVTCALDVIHPLRVAYPDLGQLTRLLKGDGSATDKTFQVKIRDLEEELSGISPDINTPLIARARLAVSEAKDMNRRGHEAVVALERSGGELMTALRGIQSKVRAAIVDSSPNLQALIESLGQLLPLLGSRITGATLSSAPTSAPIKKTSLDNEKTLTAAMKLVEEATLQIGFIVNKISTKPTAETLKTCSVDFAKTGDTIKISPAGEVTINASSGHPTNITAFGGRIPYTVDWVGQTPGQQVTLGGVKQLGQIVVSVEKDTPDSAYTLLFRDFDGAERTVIIKITGGSPKKEVVATPSVAKAASSSKAKDPDVEQTQKDLHSAGIKVAKVGTKDEPLVVDGIWGPITEAAIKQYLIEQGKGNIQDKDLPKDKDGLIKDFKSIFKKPT